MNKIDAHQHFWHFNPVRDSWITDDMSVIQNDFLPTDLQPILQAHGFEGCIAVQANQSEDENAFLLALAKEYSFIKGVVGWVNLQSINVQDRLAYYQQFKKIKGFRHILQGEAERDKMLQATFMQGISKLSNFNFTYDILILEDQLPFIPSFVKAFPNQKFIIDHIAKPNIKNNSFTNWAKNIQAVAAYPNVYCKVSGMVTEANWKQWSNNTFIPYLDTVVQCFGIDRLVYGSDWPVCLVAGSYTSMYKIVDNYFSTFSSAEQEKIFRLNAVKFYNL